MTEVSRIGLVGCVKKKAGVPMPASDLYISELFKGRRRFVERSCDRWWILSALHGLVHPGELLAPYDYTLKTTTRPERRAWAHRVLHELDERERLQPGDVVEVHAGVEYRDFGLVAGLKDRGVDVVVPALGMTQGRQLGFYKNG
jgi:hypothetical protein